MGVVSLRGPENDEKMHADPEPEGFDAFWLIYPKKQAKLDAKKAWSRIDRDLYVTILTAAVAWRRVWLKRGEMQYVPLAATWLRGERWEDELPDDARQQPVAASHVPFSAGQPLPPKGELPDHVRALLRKLTGRA